jgi:hypothetical protein
MKLLKWFMRTERRKVQIGEKICADKTSEVLCYTNTIFPQISQIPADNAKTFSVRYFSIFKFTHLLIF